MYIRRFIKEDAKEVSDLIIKTLRQVSIKDYSSDYIENLVQSQSPDDILNFAEKNHLYVMTDGKIIVACGAIGMYLDKKDEACLYKIFVDPAYQKKGLGRKVMEALEKDDYYKNAKRIEVPASLTAVDFYLKLGYKYKNNNKTPDENLLVSLEKYL